VIDVAKTFSSMTEGADEHTMVMLDADRHLVNENTWLSLNPDHVPEVSDSAAAAGEGSRAGVSRRSTRERRCPWLTISIPAGSDHCPAPAALSSSASSHEPADGAQGSGVMLASHRAESYYREQEFFCVPVTDEGRILTFACGKPARGDGLTDGQTNDRKTESVLLVD
jgi:hypothetical protein